MLVKVPIMLIDSALAFFASAYKNHLDLKRGKKKGNSSVWLMDMKLLELDHTMML